MELDLRKYIGKDYDTYNCLDLVREIYKDFFGLEIKNYFEGPIPSTEEVQSLIVSNKGNFVAVTDKKFGDIVVIRLYGIECHLGVVVDQTHFIHSAKRVGSNIDRLGRYSKLITGYFRHRELAA